MKEPIYITGTESRPLPFDITTSSIEDIRDHQAEQVAFWLLDMRDQRLGWDMLCRIRRDLTPSIYLRPIVLWLAGDDLPSDMLNAADGHVYAGLMTPTAIMELSEKFSTINGWIDELPDKSVAGDTNIAFRALRILAAGRQSLEPVTTSRHKGGYMYPMLDPLYGVRDAGMLETLNFLDEQRLITGRFVSKAHFCNHCQSAFLNFMEACPDCRSQNIVSDELVHHFKCAHTAELKEFKQGNDLICPKCDQTLNHIGVDYDKPSSVYRCNSCSNVFQDALVLSSCYHCGWTTEPENQVQRTISSYEVSALGRNAALYGLDSLFSSILEDKLQLYSTSHFKSFYDVEAARIQRYKVSTSSLLLFRIKGLDTVYIRLGERARDVFVELSTIFRSVLRQSDVITARNESVFFVIMTETSAESSHRAVERLQEGISALLQNNMDFVPDIDFQIKPIEAELDLDTTLEDFLQDSSD